MRVAMMKGCVSIFLTTSKASCAGGRLSPPAKAIIAGATMKWTAFSKQNTRATGTAAFSPKASSERPGPM